ncbi:MAG: hypothetical protein K0S55_1717 [Clostridia bacterium]|nr:hypothetical protein [Clostridia bacterium]
MNTAANLYNNFSQYIINLIINIVIILIIIVVVLIIVVISKGFNCCAAKHKIGC